MSVSVVVRHNAEAAHRLPFLGGKCTNLHGHSWWFEVTVTGAPDVNGVLLEFGELKHFVREWIDTNLDHGAMLGSNDPLVKPLLTENCKVFLFDPNRGWTSGGGSIGRPLPWPTVENVAELLRRVVVGYLCETVTRYLDVTVRVTETHVNQAVAW